jgi:hypothetical protein
MYFKVNFITPLIFSFLSISNIVNAQQSIVSGAFYQKTKYGSLHLSFGENFTQFGTLLTIDTVDNSENNNKLFSDVELYWNEGLIQPENKKRSIVYITNLENLNKSKIIVFPIPFQETINVFLNNKSYRNIHIRIFDVHGKLVLHRFELFETMLKLNTEKLNSGFYTLVVWVNNQRVYSTKIIKQQ